MKFYQRLKEKKWFAIISNVYVLTVTGFVIWMLFLDTNSWLTHKELNEEIEKLEQQKRHLKEEILKDKATLNRLRDPKELEKYARERYYMKKEGEEIYIIEYEDSLNTNQ
ncbi:septum formation initiator family protein [Sungkyunkwania multivorans]|uniref:Septum formation initiator family protein n=1 Tax=Sungkyunkwania multivorans TaxID=1173618 RepID=A0ABW3CW07_9FLAO